MATFFLFDHEVVETDGGNGCPTLWICQQIVHLKIMKIENIMLYIFYHNKKLD